MYCWLKSDVAHKLSMYKPCLTEHRNTLIITIRRLSESSPELALIILLEDLINISHRRLATTANAHHYVASTLHYENKQDCNRTTLLVHIISRGATWGSALARPAHKHPSTTTLNPALHKIPAVVALSLR